MAAIGGGGGGAGSGGGSRPIAEWLVDPARAESIVSTDCTTGKAASDSGATTLVVYHASCPDGFGAAYAAWKALGGRARYVAAEHGPRAPHDLDVRGQRVVVVDYCFPAAVTARMIREAASFLVLDHHASAADELAGVDAAHKVFEMRQSGATLAWNYFHAGVPVPTLLRYIEDKDLWRWALRGSAEFTAAFAAPFTFEAWDAAVAGGDATLLELHTRGEAVVTYRNSVVASHAARAVMCVMAAAPGWRGAIVNATTLASEIGNALALRPGVDYALVWAYNHDSASYMCSLRSASDAVDVAALARLLGGGGHKRASGFTYRGTRMEDLLLSVGGAVPPPPPLSPSPLPSPSPSPSPAAAGK